MKHYFFHIFALTVIIANYSCESVTDYYIGIPQQPELTEDTFEEGLNIFGVLRPDFKADNNKSFVFIQEVYRALSNSDFVLIKDVDVKLYELENNTIIDTVNFPLVPPDSLFSDTLYRTQEYFVPKEGTTYRMVCIHNELPMAVGEASFPPPPELIEGSLIQSNRSVSFNLQPDPLIKLVDVYYNSDDGGAILNRYVVNDSVATKVSVQLPAGLKNSVLNIYAYDANLANYYANSNTSLNFNKYRTTISTLESGFGVFGAINFTKVSLDQ